MMTNRERPLDSALHLATGLALAACRQGHKVRFYNAADLVNELILAQDEHYLPKFLATALKQHLMVLDELGFILFSLTGAQLIFQFCSALYERVAMLVTTHLRFAAWPQIFGDERLTAALMDRLTHKAHILEFIGESYRCRERMQREAEQESAYWRAVDSADIRSIPPACIAHSPDDGGWVIFRLSNGYFLIDKNKAGSLPEQVCELCGDEDAQGTSISDLSESRAPAIRCWR